LRCLARNATIARHSPREANDEKTLTREAKVELANSLRRHYQAASAREKKQILSEFVAVGGYHQKYAIQLLNAAEPSAPWPPLTTAAGV